jgi:hypothetical protein
MVGRGKATLMRCVRGLRPAREKEGLEMQTGGGGCAYFRRRQRELSNGDVITLLLMTGF